MVDKEKADPDERNRQQARKQQENLPRAMRLKLREQGIELRRSPVPQKGLVPVDANQSQQPASRHAVGEHPGKVIVPAACNGKLVSQNVNMQEIEMHESYGFAFLLFRNASKSLSSFADIFPA